MPFLLVLLLLSGQLPIFTVAMNETLIGGSPVDPKLYPEVIYISTSKGVRCSATIVGPRVVLTAAHCVTDGGQIWNANRADGKPQVLATCQRTPQYAKGTEDLDFALCRNVPGNIVGGHAATLALKGPKVGDRVILSGYGCVNPGGGGGNDGTLKSGYGKVFITPRGTNDWYYTMADDAALCFGDSGGPSFKVMDPAKGKHVVIGVNSRGNIRDMSLLTAMYIPKSRKWMQQWAKANKVKICGVNMKCKSTATAEDQTSEENEDESSFEDLGSDSDDSGDESSGVVG